MADTGGEPAAGVLETRGLAMGSGSGSFDAGLTYPGNGQDRLKEWAGVATSPDCTPSGSPPSDGTALSSNSCSVAQVRYGSAVLRSMSGSCALDDEHVQLQLAYVRFQSFLQTYHCLNHGLLVFRPTVLVAQSPTGDHASDAAGPAIETIPKIGPSGRRLLAVSWGARSEAAGNASPQEPQILVCVTRARTISGA